MHTRDACARRPNDTMHDVPGRRIAGKYELIERAGEGGMAEVWRAVTLGAAGFERPVAIKRPLEPLSKDREFIAMFIEEARVNATLDHPNIVHIHDFGMDEQGGHYLVMEWVEGLDLRRLSHSYAMEGMKLPWAVATFAMIEVLRGLHAAHTRENAMGEASPIYHRDITPQNVLAGTRGAVKITDFGLARAMDRARITTPGVVKGKLSYLSPELILEHPPSARTDLFAAGAVLYELLSGEKLFTGNTDREILEAVSRAEVPDLSLARSDVPAELMSVLRMSLARDPLERFDTARNMGLALSRVLRSHDDEGTDSEAVAQAVRNAREWLGMGTGRRSLSEIEAERARRNEAVRAALMHPVDPVEGSGTIPLPLTRRKTVPR